MRGAKSICIAGTCVLLMVGPVCAAPLVDVKGCGHDVPWHGPVDEALPAYQGRMNPRQALEVFSLSPALFVQNQGQWPDPAVRYVHDGRFADVAMTDSGIVFRVARQLPEGGSPIDMRPGLHLERRPMCLVGDHVDRRVRCFSASFVGAKQVQPTGVKCSQSVFNYHVGDWVNWREGVPSYEAVAYYGLYEGIDLHVWGMRSHLKYEFHVAPGADYHQIVIRYRGVNDLSIADDGSLAVDLGSDWGILRDDAPHIYQRIHDQTVELPGRFVVLDRTTYSFDVTGDIDPDHALVIDPNLAWSTYLGGLQDDYALAIAVDGAGNVYVAGQTYSEDWVSGGPNISLNGGLDGFLTKLTSIGGHAWSTYVGGENGDGVSDIALDAAGNVYVTGWTTSTDWIAGGYDTSFNGYMDAFVAKLTSAGGHTWSSYVGGSDMDTGSRIALDYAGNAYVFGDTTSHNWELNIWVSGGFDTELGGGRDAFVTKLTNAGGYVWGSYVGGENVDTGYGVVLDAAGHVYMTGATKSSDWAAGGFDTSFNGDADAFVMKLSDVGDHVWSTYLGGEGYDMGKGITLDTGKNVYIIGDTNSVGWVSGGFDTSFNGETDPFVAKLTSDGNHAWSTYLGGYFGDWPHDLAVDASDNVYVAGYTESEGWVSGGFDTSLDGVPGAPGDPFVAKLTGAGDHVWSTYLGGSALDSGSGIAVDATGNVYVAGRTYSDDWISGGFDTSYGGEYDAFVAKITDEAPSVRQLTPGEPYIGNISAGDWQVFFIDVEAERHLLVTLVPGLPSGRLEFYGRYGLIPTVSSYDYAARAGNALGNYELLISPTESGRYYLAVYGRDIDNPMGYTLTASFVSRHVSNVYPRVVVPSDNVSIHISGAGFVQGMQVELQTAEGAPVVANAVILSSATMIVAYFNLSGAALDLYDVAIMWPDSYRVEIPEALEVKELPQGALSAVPDLTLSEGETFAFDVNVPETLDLFVTLQKTTLVSYGNSWRGQLTLLRDGTPVASTTGSHDLILHVVDPAPGSYEISVTAEQAGDGILTAWTTLPELPLGQWTVGTIHCSYGSVWYQVDVPPGQDQLVFEAEAMGLWSHFDVYLGHYGSLDHWVSDQGTRISFDIPNPEAGTYIVEFLDSAMIYGDSGWAEDQSRDVLLKADTIIATDPDPNYAPIITRISPDKGGNTGFVTVTVEGGWLDPDATVSLVRSGWPDIVAMSVCGAPDHKMLTATFDLDGQQPGQSILVVTNSDGQTATSQMPFIVEQGGEPELWVEIVGRETIRIGRESTYILRYGNSGKVDASHVWLFVTVPESVNYEIDLPWQMSAPPNTTPSTPGWGNPMKGTLIEDLSIPAGVTSEIPMKVTVPDEMDGLLFMANITLDGSEYFQSLILGVPDEPLAFLGSSLSISNSLGQEAASGSFSLTPPAGSILIWDDYPGDFITHVAKSIGGGRIIEMLSDGIQIRSLTEQDITPSEGPGKKGGYLGDIQPPWWTEQDAWRVQEAADRIEELLSQDKLDDQYAQSMCLNRFVPPSDAAPGQIYTNCVGLTWFLNPQFKLSARSAFSPAAMYDGLKGAGNWQRDAWRPPPGSPGIGTAPSRVADAGSVERDGKIYHEGEQGYQMLREAARKMLRAVASDTPEDKYGSSGFDLPGTPAGERKRFVGADRDHYYRVDYWNKEDATAPAYDVLVEDQLEGDLDWDSFRFEDVGFLQWNRDLGSCQYFSVDVDTRPDMDWIVNVEGTFDPETGKATWWFKTLDPNTRETPEDPMAGFLPPITESGEEIGWVGFTVRPKAGLTTGAQITNQAFVEFDHAGDLYSHPAPKEGPWVNTIDAGVPSSSVASLPETTETLSFTVQWTGQDDAGGSGVGGYDVYVSEDGGDYVRWLANTPDPNAVFAGRNNHTYAFYSRARDNVGNVEPAPAEADATTRIEGACVLSDMNWDGFTSIVGDVPAFVNVVYFADYAWYEQQFPGQDPNCPGDCNGDGILSIVGDVPCFVDCVYFGNCN